MPALRLLQPLFLFDGHQDSPKEIGHPNQAECVIDAFGDLGSPQCSACIEARITCTYSRTRKRPGPIRGSHRKPRGLAKQGQVSQDETGPPTTVSRTAIRTPTEILPFLPQYEIYTISQFQSISSDSMDLALHNSQLSLEQEQELHQNFASTINTVFPLFQQASFPGQLKDKIICGSLLSVINTLSAKTIETHFWHAYVDMDSGLRCLADSIAVDVESPTDPLALSQWRTACLLAWYSLNQTVSKGEAIRIAVLTRKAYQCGLHQIDSTTERATYGWDMLDEDLLEDWRQVWWCVRILDCHISFLTAMPHQIEPESVFTALPQNLPPDHCNQNPTVQKLFLPLDRSALWKLVQDISNVQGDRTSSLHIAISSILREAVTLRRLQCQNPSQSIRERMSTVENNLTAMQLALPSNYMQQTRDFLHGESDITYHHRLLTLLKIYATRLILRLPFRLHNASQWHTRWQESLEICYDMVAVIQKWDIRCTPAIDPAVCFVALSLLIILHLHNLSNGLSRPPIREQLARRKNIIRLFLQNYASFWALPKFFLDCYDTFALKYVEPLNPGGIDYVIEQFNGPLNRKWLSFLSITLPVSTCASEFQPVNPSSSLPATAPSISEGLLFGEDLGLWDNFTWPAGLGEVF